MSAEILQFVAMEDAPNRIRELRMLQTPKMSQQRLGDMIGVSKVTISDLELGKMRLDVEYMRRIGRALGVAPAELLPERDNPWQLTDEERMLIEHLRRGSLEQREQVKKVADVIIPFLAEPREAA